jgi:anaerobic sulfite reductase subunit A
MSNTAELKTLHRNRENLYTLISGIYLCELDGERLEAMKRMNFPAVTGDDTLGEGYTVLASYLKAANEAGLEDLAVDYARVFLAAGVAQGLAAFPYESIYRDERRLIAQEPIAEVTAIYAAKGIAPSTAPFKAPEDHIGFETAFMARLCGEAREALEREDKAAYAASLGEQREFLEKHLLRWFSDFCRDVDRYAFTGFYQGAAKITQGFLERERMLMEGGEELWAVV